MAYWFTDDLVFESVAGLAVKFKVMDEDGNEYVFLPISKINANVNWYDCNPGDKIQVSMPEWLAQEKGLI